ncbi:MAG: hypothetical protein U0931_05430 [Vulcanimicrobiota bacterium]
MIEGVGSSGVVQGFRPATGLPARPAAPSEPAAPDQVLLTAQQLAQSVPVETSFGPTVTESAPPPVSQKDQTPADPFRAKARQVVARAREQISQTAWGSLFVDELEPLVVEQTALNLFERSLGNNPQPGSQVEMKLGSAGDAFSLKSLAVSEGARGLARQGQYLSFLSASSGAGPLSPALMSILSDFDTDKLQKLSNSPVGTILAASTSSQTFAHEGVQISGCRSDRERETIGQALSYLKDRCPAALEATKLVVLESAPLPDGPATVTHGQVFQGHPTAVLRRSVCDTTESTQWVLYHEIGHIMDNAGGYTRRPDSPFGKGEAVSRYAATATPDEDFAETHADVLKNWDSIKHNPDLFIHASGATGAKRAWILKEVYGQDIPPASQQCQQFMALNHGEGPVFDKMPVLKVPGPAFGQFRQLLVKQLQDLSNAPGQEHPDDRDALNWARTYLNSH